MDANRYRIRRLVRILPRWSILWAGAGGRSGLIDLVTRRTEFRRICDRSWKEATWLGAITGWPCGSSGGRTVDGVDSAGEAECTLGDGCA